jgi:hypothetical protein
VIIPFSSFICLRVTFLSYAFFCLPSFRLGLWGYGTEHPQGFSQFLKGIKQLGTGAMELHAMHLKSIGAIVARTLSYEACEFELIEDVSDDSVRKIYNDAANLWSKCAVCMHHILDFSHMIRL